MASPRAPGARHRLIAGLAGFVAVGVVALAVPATVAEGATGEGESLGREVFDAHCAMCHGSDGAGMMGMHPSLRGSVERLGREGVEVTTRLGRDVQPPMPGFADRLSEEEITAVIDYVETLPRGPRNFGPSMDERDGMAGDGGMRGPDGMMGEDGMPLSRRGSWTAVLVLSALLTGLVGGLVGYLVGRRARASGRSGR